MRQDDRCVHCGHESAMPFYQGYKAKRYRYFTKHDIRCPKCKRVNTNDPTACNFTPAELEARQVGKPSICCGAPWVRVYEYGEKSVCKKCGKLFFRKDGE